MLYILLNLKYFKIFTLPVFAKLDATECEKEWDKVQNGQWSGVECRVLGALAGPVCLAWSGVFARCLLWHVSRTEQGSRGR